MTKREIQFAVRIKTVKSSDLGSSIGPPGGMSISESCHEGPSCLGVAMKVTKWNLHN